MSNLPLLAAAAERLGCVPNDTVRALRIAIHNETAWMLPGETHVDNYNPPDLHRCSMYAALRLYCYEIQNALMQPPHNWTFDFHNGEFRATGKGIVTAPTMAELLVLLTEGMR